MLPLLIMLAVQAPVRVLIATELGQIEVEVDTARAPLTSENFSTTSTPATTTAGSFIAR